MNEDTVLGDTQDVEHTDCSMEVASEEIYTLTQEDEIELQSVRSQLGQLRQRIDKLVPTDSHLEGLREPFPFGTGGNRRSGGTQFQKRFDLSIERAAKASPFYQEFFRLLEEEQALLTGARAKERLRVATRQRKREEDVSRVRHAQPGDYVVDSAYGTVLVVRVNSQSLTIETEAGRREARKFSLIRRVAFTEEEIIGWFVKRDERGEFPIRVFVHEAGEGSKPIEEIVARLKDETQKRYPDFISNLPWQQIAQHFLDEAHGRMKPEQGKD